MRQDEKLNVFIGLSHKKTSPLIKKEEFEGGKYLSVCNI